MTAWAAMLKGINVGGNSKLPMAELREICEELRYRQVKTLLASGNVTFHTDGSAAEIVEELEEALAAHRLRTKVLLRTREELEAAVKANPFPDAAEAHPNHLLILFHREPFPEALLDKLAAVYDGPERLKAVGCDLYIDYPEDIGHSKLHQATAKLKFPAVSTGRNWNTIAKLIAQLG
ncbi:DUF1697 domain-containing protein [Sphingomonas sp.]|uniref:DUF1697 domain-containing protein n=1 Tax=Sphingomonas sp. TaxID=28214 RepID=UPI001B2C50E2|nr:DUF1697 domain-containing protein [Sphingomonas sp.]MBO9713985.1 DUF1697 domain-containing protein [Sphingomonas sp.]